MYSKSQRTVVPVNTKYTQYVEKLNDHHIKQVINPSDSNLNSAPNITGSIPVIVDVEQLVETSKHSKPDLHVSRNQSKSKSTMSISKPTTKTNRATNNNNSSEATMVSSGTSGGGGFSNKNKTTKFAELFTPEESNALQLYILQKAASAPNMNEVITSEEDEEGMFGGGGLSVGRRGDALHLINKSPSSKRRRSADNSQPPAVEVPLTDMLHTEPLPQLANTPDHADYDDDVDAGNDPFGNKLRTSSESIANIVYSSIRPGLEGAGGNAEFDTNLPTGSDSKQDYDPHEPLPNVDQLALRHELLNNIRAISRATYFEDLYSGKVIQNDGPPEAEILEILQNSDGRLSQDERERVEDWVRESIHNSANIEMDVDSAGGDDDTLPPPLPTPQAQPLLHHWKPTPTSPGDALRSELVVAGDEDARPTGETGDSVNKNGSYRTFRNSQLPEVDQVPQLLPEIINPPLTRLTTRDKRPYSFSQHDSGPTTTIITKPAPTHIAPSGLSKTTNNHTYANNKGGIVPPPPPYTSITQSTVPNFSRHFPNNETASTTTSGVEQVQRLQRLGQIQEPIAIPMPRHHRPPTYPVRKPNVVAHHPQNFSNSSSVVSIPASLPTNSNSNATTNKGRNHKGPHHKGETGSNNSFTSKYTKIPRIYQRQNMNQWVAKKVWFYMNGDDRFPRIEYRFRPRDLQTMDNLLNLLNKKMPQLPQGARYVFTLDGRLIESVDELKNEQAYVVSSIRKFKPLNYAIRRKLTTKQRSTDDEHSPRATPTFQNLPPIVSRSKSTGLNLNQSKNPPLIRIRRARSQKSYENSTKSSSIKMKISSSETNLNRTLYGDQTLNSLGYISKNKSMSVSSNNLNITNNNNNSIKPTKTSNYNSQLTEGGRTRRKSYNENSHGKSEEGRSKSDIPRIVAEVIGEASSHGTKGRIRLERQMVRIINGADPSVQSQVLLNTKTSQPFGDLVRDLGLAVKLPHSRKVGNRLETLYGRQVRSYSQLRSELKVGNNTFYIYVDMDEEDEDYHSSLLPNLQRQRLSIITPLDPHRVKRSTSNVSDRSLPRPKISLTKTLSNSSSELSTFTSTRYLDAGSYHEYNANAGQRSGSQRRRHRRRSQVNSLTASPSASTFHLPPIVGDKTNVKTTRKRSVSPIIFPSPHLHYPINAARTVHFQT